MSGTARFMPRMTYTLVFVIVFAVVGKACQYATVDWLQPRLGFEGASAVGLTPFIALMLFAKSRASTWFDWRAR